MSDEFIISLGTAQDGGYPHVGCVDICCNKVNDNPDLKRLIASISIVDPRKGRFWIIDISPDINDQLRLLSEYIKKIDSYSFAGIFLTHAHIGHYAGLLNLGLEALNLSNIPVYVFPRMKSFLEESLVFRQLLDNKNIILKNINNHIDIKLTESMHINAFLVPHRNELSETVGYRINNKNKTMIYIPDIDSWEDWDIDINALIKKNDILILDGTFYSKSEIKNRDIKKIPHPSIKHSMDIMNINTLEERNKIYFTHLNHTNKVLDENSIEYKDVITSGYNILRDKKIFTL